MIDFISKLSVVVNEFLVAYRCSGSRIDTISMQKGMDHFIEFLTMNPYIPSIQSIERWEIEKYIDFLTQYEYKAKNPYRPNFIYRNLRALYKFFEYLTINADKYDASYLPKAGLIRRSDFPAPNRRSNKHFPEWLDKLLHEGILNMKLPKDLKHARRDNLRFQTQMLIIYHTGMRVNDIVNLEQDCLYMRQGKPWMRIFARKTNRYYEIPIVDELYKAILYYKDMYADELEKIPNERIPDSDVIVKRLFAPSRPLKTEDDYDFEKHKLEGKITRFCKKIVDEAERNGVDISYVKEGFSVTAHKYRHNFAIKLVRLGADPLTIAEFLGHKDLSMAQAYIQEDQEHILSIMDELTEMGILEGHDMGLRPNLYTTDQIMGYQDEVRKVNGGYCTFLNGEAPCGEDPYRCWDCDKMKPDKENPEYEMFLLRQKEGHNMLLQRAKELGIEASIEREKHVLEMIEKFQKQLEIERGHF